MSQQSDFNISDLDCVEFLGKIKKSFTDRDVSFVERVKNDIKSFLEADVDPVLRILTFPPLDPQWRYLIHKVSEQVKLKSIAIGEGVRRLTMVMNPDKLPDGVSDAKNSSRSSTSRKDSSELTSDQPNTQSTKTSKIPVSTKTTPLPSPQEPEHIKTTPFMPLDTASGATKKKPEEKKYPKSKIVKKTKGVTFSLTSGKSNAMENFKEYEETKTLAQDTKTNKLNIKASEFVPEPKKPQEPPNIKPAEYSPNTKKNQEFELISKKTQESPPTSKKHQALIPASKKSQEPAHTNKKTQEPMIIIKKTQESVQGTKKTTESVPVIKKSQDFVSTNKKSQESVTTTKKTQESMHTAKKSQESMLATKKNQESAPVTKKSQESPTNKKSSDSVPAIKKPQESASRISQESVSTSKKGQESVPATKTVHEFVPTATKIQEFLPVNKKISEFVPASKKIQEFVPANKKITEFVPASKKIAEFVPASKKTQECMSERRRIQESERKKMYIEAPRFCHTVRYPHYDTCARYHQYNDTALYPLTNIRGCYYHTFTNENYNYRSNIPRETEESAYGTNLDHGDDDKLDLPYPSFYNSKGIKTKHFPVVKKDEEMIREQGYPISFYDKEGKKCIVFDKETTPKEPSTSKNNSNKNSNDKNSSNSSIYDDDDKITNPEYDSQYYLSDSSYHEEGNVNDITNGSDISLPVPGLDLNGISSATEQFMEDSEPIFHKNKETNDAFEDQTEDAHYTSEKQNISTLNDDIKTTQESNNNQSRKYDDTCPSHCGEPEIVIKFKPFSQDSHSKNQGTKFVYKDIHVETCKSDDLKDTPQKSNNAEKCNCNCHSKYKLNNNQETRRDIPGITLHIFWEKNYLMKE